MKSLSELFEHTLQEMAKASIALDNGACKMWPAAGFSDTQLS